MLSDELVVLFSKYIENMEFIINDLEAHVDEKDYICARPSGYSVKGRVIKFPHPDVSGTYLVGYESRKLVIHVARSRMKSAKEILAGADEVADWIYGMFSLSREISARLNDLMYDDNIPVSWRELLLNLAPNIDHRLMHGNLWHIFKACVSMEDDYLDKLEAPYYDE